MWKSRLLFLFAAFCSMALIRFYDNKNIAFLTVYALIILVVFSLLAVFTAPMFLKLEERADQVEVFKNEHLQYAAKLVNKGIFFYPRVLCGYYSGELIEYGTEMSAVVPRGTLQNTDEVQFPYRGVYRIGIQDITVTDFLGLFQITFPVNNPVTVTVLPESDEDFLIHIPSDSQNTAFKQDLYNESYTDIADVRKYAPSDSLRKIHWKLSAKRGELMVKNYQSFEPNETLLFVDAVESTLPEAQRAAFEDKIISYAAAAVDYCMMGRLAATLVSGDTEEEWAVIDPAEDPAGLYRTLAQVAFDREESAFPGFCQNLQRQNKAYNLLVFLWRLDQEVVAAMERFVTYEDRIHVYYFYTENLPVPAFAKELMDRLRAMGATVNIIDANPVQN